MKTLVLLCRSASYFMNSVFHNRLKEKEIKYTQVRTKVKRIERENKHEVSNMWVSLWSNKINLCYLDEH